MAFFDDHDDKEKEEELTKIKVGDQEFSEDELSALVEKGRLAKDIEEKQNTDLSKVYPEYTRKSQQLKEYEEELAQLRELKKSVEEREIEEKANKDSKSLTPDEVRQMAAKQGYITQENVNTYIQNYMAAQRILDQVKDLEAKRNPFEAEELPRVESQEMLRWMDENNITDPVKAYKIRFESEIDAWKEKKIAQGKPKGMYVDDTSAPSNKLPREVKISNKNLQELMRASLSGEL